MRLRSVVPAVVAALAMGGFTAYAANSHGSTASTHATTALVQAAIHSERTRATAGDTITPIGALLPAIRAATVPNTGTQTALLPQVQVQTTQQATTTCETADQETGDQNLETGTAAESETGDHNNEAADANDNAANSDTDEAQEACQPVTAACTAALDALKAFRAADKAEDLAEPRPETDAAKAADKTEDAAEKLALKTDVQAVIAACGGHHED